MPWPPDPFMTRAARLSPGEEDMPRRKKTITIRLTEAESEGLMRAGLAGIADLHDAGDDESLAAADDADFALNVLGAAMQAAWPETVPE